MEVLSNTILVGGKEVLLPKAAGQLINNATLDVKIISEGVDKTAAEIFEEIRSGRLNQNRFQQHELHPSSPASRSDERRTIDWLFVVDTLNFSFWSPECNSGFPSSVVYSSELIDQARTAISEKNPKWKVKYKDKVYSGYFALCAGINRAIDEGVDMTNPEVYGELSEEEILHIFRSETLTPIPMVKDRVRNLKEVSQVLLEKYQGSFLNCVNSCGQNAQRLLRQVVTDFPCFRDHSFFETRNVAFWKRAQILIGDIWACYGGEGVGTFNDIETLTMFADYRVPQVLLHFGALKYSPQLLRVLGKGEELTNGDRMEVEIRGCSIHVVELIKDKVRELLTVAALPKDSVNSVIIDHFLWDYRRSNVEQLDKLPYHRTRCIYY